MPFGEFLPLENILSKLGLKSLTNNYQSYSKGKNEKSINIKDIDLNFLATICYEIIYSGELNLKSEYDLIINVSEDGWFGKSIGPHQHFAHSIFRAIENGRTVIRSANNGISVILSFNIRDLLNKPRTIQPVKFLNLICSKSFPIISDLGATNTSANTLCSLNRSVPISSSFCPGSLVKCG